MMTSYMSKDQAEFWFLSSLSVGHYELCRDNIGDLLGSPDHL